MHRSTRSCSAPPGNDAGCTSRATCWPKCRRDPRRWSPPRSARSSLNPTPLPSLISSTRSPRSWAASSPPSRPCCATPPSTSARSHPSRKRTGARSGRPTRSSASTRRSSGAPTSSGIFPNEAGVLRLAGSVLLEVHDEWQVTDRRYLSEGSMAKLYEIDNDDETRRRWDREPTSCSPDNQQQPHQRRRSHRRSHFPPLQGARPWRGPDVRVYANALRRWAFFAVVTLTHGAYCEQVHPYSGGALASAQLRTGRTGPEGSGGGWTPLKPGPSSRQAGWNRRRTTSTATLKMFWPACSDVLAVPPALPGGRSPGNPSSSRRPGA